MTTPEALPDDIAALKRIIADMARDAVSARTEIARLKFLLSRYRRAEFGRSSEMLARDTEQLELAIETLECDQAERLSTAEAATSVESAAETQKPARRLLPEHLPREEVMHRAAAACPSYEERGKPFLPLHLSLLSARSASHQPQTPGWCNRWRVAILRPNV